MAEDLKDTLRGLQAEFDRLGATEDDKAAVFRHAIGQDAMSVTGAIIAMQELVDNGMPEVLVDELRQAHPVYALLHDAGAAGKAPTHDDLLAACRKVPKMETLTHHDAIKAHFGCGMPTREMIDAIVAAGPALDAGAGQGFWSYFVREAGGDVLAVDNGIWAKPGRGGEGMQVGRWHPVKEQDAVEAVRDNPDRNVLMVWDLGCGMDVAVCDEMKSGRLLFHHGEIGGCTNSDGFDDYLQDRFDLLYAFPRATMWGLKDGMMVLRKR